MRSPSAHKLQVARFGAVAVVLVCALAAPPKAHSQSPAKTAGKRASVVSKSATSIRGVALDADSSPIPGARVQLRNLVTGKVHGTAVANEAGQFAFNPTEGGRYVVELLGASGKVTTAGQAFVIAPGDSLTTFVRMGTKGPWFTGIFANFSNAAAAVSSTAASQGITAIAPVQYCASPPCSPN